MENRNKKLEILYIHDIKASCNDNFSKKTNHYLQNLLFNLRLVFRYNSSHLDGLIDLYCYIEDILNGNIPMDEEELKILIYRITDVMLNIEQYGIKGELLITETISHLQQSLYNELEKFKLQCKHMDDKLYNEKIEKQIKNQAIDFDVLIEILNEDNIGNIKEITKKVLENNYQQEYKTYKARKDYLEY